MSVYLYKRDGMRNIRKIECKICNKSYSIVGIATHLKDTHKITVNEYTSVYEEYRPKYIDYKEEITITGRHLFSSDILKLAYASGNASAIKVIKEDTNLIRDEENNAVLNTNVSGLEAYKKQRDKQRKVDNMVNDVDKLKTDLKDIKDLLEQLLNKK